MSDAFDVDWLASREPADHAARAGGAIERSLPARARTRGVDLGGGTGSNLRYLMPRLGGEQHWLLLDHDPALLAAAGPRFAHWATAGGLRCSDVGDEIVIAAPDWSARIRLRQADLAVVPRPEAPATIGPADAIEETFGKGIGTGIEEEIGDGIDLVTASALLDLVGRAWIDRLVAWCASRRADWLFALTFDGRIEWRPPAPEDEAVRLAFERDQRRDKGFGPALGSAAIDALGSAATARGYRVATARTDWDLDGSARSMQRRLAADLAAVAHRVHDPAADRPAGGAADVLAADPARIDRWLQRRQAAIDGGGAALVVGHQDLCGVLPR